MFFNGMKCNNSLIEASGEITAQSITPSLSGSNLFLKLRTAVMKTFHRGTSIAIAGLVLLTAGSAHAQTSEFIIKKYGVKESANAWVYCKLVKANKGNSSSYIPRPADYEKATPIGKIAFPRKTMLDTIDAGASMFNEDTIRVFITEVRSDKDIVIPLKILGDDGFSVSIDGKFVTGGESTASRDFNLKLKAGVPTVLEIAGYNGPGAWALGLSRQDNGKLLETTPGVTLSAELNPQVQLARGADQPKQETTPFPATPRKSQAPRSSNPGRQMPNGPRPEITVRNFVFEEKFGLVEITGEVRNMTKANIEVLNLKFDFVQFVKKTDTATLKLTGPFEPGKWEKFQLRVELKRFTDYQFSVTDQGNNPLLWAIQPK